MGEDKQLGAILCVAIRHPDDDAHVVGVIQVRPTLLVKPYMCACACACTCACACACVFDVVVKY